MEERLENEVITSTEEINDLLERLKFSEEESVQVVSTSDDKRTQGFESWAVGKIMAREQPNREAMYRVFKSLWYTKKELFDRCLFVMVPFEKGKNFDSYDFCLSPFWLRVYSLPIEVMDRQTTLNIGNAIGELMPIDWKDRDGGWTEFMRLPDFCYTCGLIGHSFRTCESNKEGVAQNGLNHQYEGWLRVPIVNPNQDRGMRRNRVELVKSKDNTNADKEGSHTNSRDESGLPEKKGMERLCVEESPSVSSLDRRSGGWNPAPPRTMNIFCWNCRGVGNPATVRELKQLLVANTPNVIFLCEIKIQSNGLSRIRSRCRLEGCLAVNSDGKSGGLALLWRKGVTADQTSKHLSWDILRRVKSTVKEGWIVGGDFNAILNNAEEDGGRRKSRRSMDEFRDILDELALIDVKPTNGWFTWSNNREGPNLVKERLDRFLISEDMIQEARDLIKRIWDDKNSDMLSKIDMVCKKLGPWQHRRYKRMKIEINRLEKNIGKVMDGPISVESSRLLKKSRDQLGQWYDTEEKYWAPRGRKQWLREGDRNT
ncbi:hypothetical protein Goshw_019304, partial [Gossypium schwendimanii]|nr:hypothetical protein [Gossypium schwendimanii]